MAVEIINPVEFRKKYNHVYLGNELYFLPKECVEVEFDEVKSYSHAFKRVDDSILYDNEMRVERITNSKKLENLTRDVVMQLRVKFACIGPR